MTLPLPPQHIKSKSTWDPNLNPNPTIYIYIIYISIIRTKGTSALATAPGSSWTPHHRHHSRSDEGAEGTTPAPLQVAPPRWCRSLDHPENVPRWLLCGQIHWSIGPDLWSARPSCHRAALFCFRTAIPAGAGRHTSKMSGWETACAVADRGAVEDGRGFGRAQATGDMFCHVRACVCERRGPGTASNP